MVAWYPLKKMACIVSLRQSNAQLGQIWKLVVVRGEAGHCHVVRGTAEKYIQWLLCGSYPSPLTDER